MYLGSQNRFTDASNILSQNSPTDQPVPPNYLGSHNRFADARAMLPQNTSADQPVVSINVGSQNRFADASNILSQNTEARGRSVFEDIADALRGEGARVAVAPHLKIPQQVEDSFAWMYPHLFCGDPRGWAARLREFQTANFLFVKDPH
jgi:hypothetical protein